MPRGRHRRHQKRRPVVAAAPVALALPLIAAPLLTSDGGVGKVSRWWNADHTGDAADSAAKSNADLSRRAEHVSRAERRTLDNLPSDFGQDQVGHGLPEQPQPTHTPKKTAKPSPKPTSTATKSPSPKPKPTHTSTPTPKATTASAGTSVADAKAYAQSVLSSADYAALDQLAIHESSWNPHAVNPTSGAYGIPQALPGDKMATISSDWRDNAVTQVKWMINYCQSRYGSVSSAWDYWQAHNYY